ncbi:MAG: DUF1349 domain-containing protein [Candidatus Hydrogenedentes bacterium]|nr:DUF1349 domain-containing protein [Candidatus Hydrogenedentota bacterium]
MDITGVIQGSIVPFLLLLAAVAEGERSLLNEDFEGKIGEDWTWVREHAGAWRATEHGLEIRVEPGNMWGGANDARNVLIRPLPPQAQGEITVSAKVENHPTAQFEQVDLVWYYDDSNMVKIGLELVDKQLSLVMGREEADKTRTLAIIPLESTSVYLRLIVKGNHIRGQFRVPESEEWRDAGECESPAKGEAKLSLQAYQGPPDAEHWARITEFRVAQTDE